MNFIKAIIAGPLAVLRRWGISYKLRQLYERRPALIQKPDPAYLIGSMVCPSEAQRKVESPVVTGMSMKKSENEVLEESISFKMLDAESDSSLSIDFALIRSGNQDDNDLSAKVNIIWRDQVCSRF